MNDPYDTIVPAPGESKSAVEYHDPDAPPQQIGRYRVEKILGKGGFGLVYLAYDDQLKRAVAIKMAHARLIAHAGDAEAYLTEARTVANLDHPHIVPVYDVGSTEQFPCFVVSKYIDGTDLYNRLKQSRLSLNESVDLVATVAEALHYAHKQEIIHRDIKPGNILLDKAGKPFVADFGLALREQDVGRGPTYAGTPAYMSPEQARGEGHRVDGRSDIFSLGIVFYELLTGKRPFKGESTAEVMSQVTTFEPRPPRQLDDRIPKELERICLKALAKRASERHSTAKDLADDLRLYLASASHDERSVITHKAVRAVEDTAAISTPLSTRMSTPHSNQAFIRIVPKGLRSFDAHDADFFLELLPGPRDREGLPESLRFWKNHIEQMDADNTFTVGLIYGPSGCGKSSLIKAGLLPRLSDDVIAVYVEATAEETETRLLNGLRKRCPTPTAKLGLKETLAAIRRGQGVPAGKKVLIVIDQFEQWLHARKDEEDTELVQALRQCDGGRVQCIVMVRDDFWLAVSRFLRELEIRLLEGQNSALADLFDIDHARKVLAAFGRAFGKLPENPGETSKEQKEFLNQAVAGLAQEGKVISVRLALFVEMMKGKPWTPAALKEVGGTEGVGVTFLEETFSAANASAEHRYHQKAAREVLKALLPDSGTDIKGHMRSYSELLEASGNGSRPKDFDDLIRILDSEIRLITPTDPGMKEGDSSAHVQAGQKYFQLTHDYLVPSLRDWLTRKQKETRRGRAELLLEDRAAVWNARPENRQLPSLWQWASIRWHTQKKKWTPPQRKMMRKAARYYGVQGLVAAAFLFAVLLVGIVIRDRVLEHNQATRAAGLVHRLLAADTAGVQEIIDELEGYRTWADPLLKEEYDKQPNDSPKKLHASLALLRKDKGYLDYVFPRLLKASPQEIWYLHKELQPHRGDLQERLLKAVLPDGSKTAAETQEQKGQRFCAACCLACLASGRGEDWPTSPAISAFAVESILASIQANPSNYPVFLKMFEPVRENLLAPLSSVFRNRARSDSERSLATSLLAEYAKDRPEVLADLLMDADEAQFAVLYPKFKQQSEKGIPVLAAEIDKKPMIVKDKTVFEERNGMITENDGKVKTQTGPLPAKRYELRLRSGIQYRITMDSKDLDSFLVLQDKAGKELGFDDDTGGDQNSLLMFMPLNDDTYAIYAASFKGTGSFVLKIVETMAGDGGKDKLAKRQANAAVALLKLNQPEKIWPMLKHSADPGARSYLIHRFGPLGADAQSLVKRLEDEPDVTIRRALILSLGEFSEKDWSAEDRNRVTKNLQEIYVTATDPGLHAASEWLLRHWQHDAWLKQMNDDWAKDTDQRAKRLDDIGAILVKKKEKTPPQWYVNGQGHTMVVIPGPVTFEMGSPITEPDRFGDQQQHRCRIARTFAVAAKSVTVEQYRQFDEGFQVTAKYTPSTDAPANMIDWYLAAKYCNWLSEKEGIDPKEWCYEIKANAVKLRHNYLSLSGYRLPTEAEMEYAARAGAITSRYFGDAEELLPKYAWHRKNSEDRTWPVAMLKPNDLGLFDVQGNVFTWCQESYKAYPTGNDGETIEDQEDKAPLSPAKNRVFRGGSFSSQASFVRLAYRNSTVPSTRDYGLGLRVARTLPAEIK